MAMDGAGIVGRDFDGGEHEYKFNEQWTASAEKEAAMVVSCYMHGLVSDTSTVVDPSKPPSGELKRGIIDAASQSPRLDAEDPLRASCGGF